MGNDFANSHIFSTEAIHELLVVLILKDLELIYLGKGDVDFADFLLLAVVHLLDIIHLADEGHKDILERKLPQNAFYLIMSHLHR